MCDDTLIEDDLHFGVRLLPGYLHHGVPREWQRARYLFTALYGMTVPALIERAMPRFVGVHVLLMIAIASRAEMIRTPKSSFLRSNAWSLVTSAYAPQACA